MTADEEARLVAAARGGDARAFAALVTAHQQAVRGFLRRFTGPSADADDMAQEAFVTAWRRLDRFEGRSSLRSWICGIGLRIARDARRSRSRSERRERDWVGEQDGAESAPAEDRIALAQAMALLPEEQRAAVALCLGEGFSHAEAAAILKAPIGTIKSHVARGRERLLRALEDTP